LNSAKPAGDEMGVDKITGLKIWKKVGRFGPYLQLGEKGEVGFKMKSIPKLINPDEITMEQVTELLAWPKVLGKLENGSEILFDIGPYGPYLKSEGKNKSVPATYDILKLTLKDADEIWKAPAVTGAARFGAGARATTPPLKDFGNGMVVKTGRYGAYVTDGKTNASLPKGQSVEELTSEQALELIKGRQK